MLSINAYELQDKIHSKEDFILVDVRERSEHDEFNIGGLLIPMNTIFDNLSKIDLNKQVVVYCQKGIRSQIVIQRLEQKCGFTNLINLQGGMDGWIKCIKK